MSGSKRVRTAGLCQIKQASSADKKDSQAGRELGRDKGKQEDGSLWSFKLERIVRQ